MPNRLSSSPGTRRRPRLTFRQYLQLRLGTRGGGSAWFNFFIKPFAARSFAEFWRLWNPVYGYFLYWFSYRPLVRVSSAKISSGGISDVIGDAEGIDSRVMSVPGRARRGDRVRSPR